MIEKKYFMQKEDKGEGMEEEEVREGGMEEEEEEEDRQLHTQ